MKFALCLTNLFCVKQILFLCLTNLLLCLTNSFLCLTNSLLCLTNSVLCLTELAVVFNEFCFVFNRISCCVLRVGATVRLSASTTFQFQTSRLYQGLLLLILFLPVADHDWCEPEYQALLGGGGEGVFLFFFLSPPPAESLILRLDWCDTQKACFLVSVSFLLPVPAQRETFTGNHEHYVILDSHLIDLTF